MSVFTVPLNAWRLFFQGMAHAAVSEGPEVFLERSAREKQVFFYTAAQAVWDVCTRGVPLPEAFEVSHTHFPPLVLGVVREGFAHAVLDYAMHDAAQSLDPSQSPSQAHEALSRVLARYELHSNNAFICHACAERSLRRIVRRAQSEGASSVYLRQEDGFFVQSYLAYKLVRISEPSHDKTLHTLIHLLEDAHSKGTLTLSEEVFEVRCLEPSGVELRSASRHLQIVYT